MQLMPRHDGPVKTPEPGYHPDWCVLAYCTATGHSGAHRSAPIRITDLPALVTANLYASAFVPEQVTVEQHTPTLLPLGMVETFIGVLTELVELASEAEAAGAKRADE